MRKHDIMQSIELFRELVQDIDVTEIPVKYIAAACHIDRDGMENVVTGDDLDDLMARRFPYEDVQDINLLLDLKVMAVDVSIEVSYIFERISDRMDKGEY